jgi:ATP-dependent DNA helicase RecG
MTLDELDQIIQQGEGLKIEFKEASNSVPSSMYETVVSFSNTDGGTILLGVEDDGRVKGIDRGSQDKIQTDLVTTLNERDCVNPPLYVQPIPIEHRDGLVLALQIQSSSQIHDHAGRIYCREHQSDIDVTDNQQKVGDLYFRKRNFFTEGRIYPQLAFSDLDDGLFVKARNLIRSYRGDHPWLSVDDEQMLRDSTLWRKDFATGEEGLTLAAALIFGKDSTIQALLSAYKVEAMVRIKDKDRWDDRITLRKNLIDTYLELKQFIDKYLPEKFYLEGDQRIDLRDVIFREVIGNVIVHREYTSALSTDLIISESDVTVTNPNKPLFHGPIDPRGFNPFPKNPNIRKFFTELGWTDEIGSGIRNTFKYLPRYVPNAEPVFIENDTFKTQIPLRWASLGEYAEEFYQWMEFPDPALAQLQRGLVSVPLPPELHVESWGGLLLYLVPSWHQKGTLLAGLKWPKNQLFREDEIKNVPSWSKKSTQLLNKKTRYLIGILSLTTEPISTTELLQIFDYKNEKSFRDTYLKPLREEGLITFTNPEKPTDPENKYVITEAGKLFLAGR